MRKKSRMLFIQRKRKNSRKLIIYKVDSSVKGLEDEIAEISQRVKKKKKKRWAVVRKSEKTGEYSSKSNILLI